MKDGYVLVDEASLEGRNTFRVKAKAALLADVTEAHGLEALFALPQMQFGPVMVLGEGSNVLFAGDYAGTVVAIRGHRIEVLDAEDGATRIRVGAGANWNDFVRWSLGHGFTGLENLSLIPGTVGAGPIQNIGAYGVELAEFVVAVEAFDREAGRNRRVEREDCGFGYRDSVFKRAPDRWIVQAVEFALRRDRAPTLAYAGINEELDAMGVGGEPRPSQVAEAVIRLRTRKLPDPAVIGNAGSFFKNPVVGAATAEALAQAHPGMPVFGEGATRKLSAAWMIEACGWKGRRRGDAGVAEGHALVLVNHGGASGAELLALAVDIAADVHARFGVALEPEPRIIGADWTPPT